MEKYGNLISRIKKIDIASFKGLEKEVSFGPVRGFDILPLEISRFGITYPDAEYYIKRSPSNVFVIEYIVSGEGYLEINGKKHKLRENDAYIIHPGDHCEYYSDKNNPYKKYWINFTSQIHIPQFLSIYKISERVIRNIDLSKFFEEIFELESISNLNENLCLYASRIIYNIFHEIAIHKKLKTDSATFDLAVNVRNELRDHIQIPITVNEIASKYYRSKNEIISQFKKKYNVTPYAYLIELRILFAKQLLANSNDKIIDISNRLCFSSEFHFSNCFKAKVGISPREYRKNASAQGK